MAPSVLLAALMAAACLVHGTESAAPRRSLMVGSHRSDSDRERCWESLLTLGLCKHDLLASFFTGRPLPPACCRAADEIGHHCSPFTRAFVGSLLPHGPLVQCTRLVITGAPTTTLPSQRRAPPRAPALETGPRVSGGARPPPAPKAQTGAGLTPPRAPTRASSGTRGTPGPTPPTIARLPAPGAPRIPRGAYGPPVPPKPHTSARPPPSSAVVVTPMPPGWGMSVWPPPPEEEATAVPPRGRAPSPKAARGTRAPAVSGGARDGSPPKPKVIAGGSAGGRTRRAPDAYGAGAGAPMAAVAELPKGARTARPSPKSLPYGTPV